MPRMDYTSHILILGSSGLIGSACLRYLQSNCDCLLLHPSRHELDLLDKEAVLAYFKRHQPHIVILAAGMVGGIQYNKIYPADFINCNLAIQLNVFQAACQVHIKKFIFFGSSCMYPRDCFQPMHENLLFTGLPESTSMSYAVSKLTGLQMCHAYNQQYKQGQYIALIPNSTYGPYDDFNPATAHVISALIVKMHHAKLKRSASLTLLGTGHPRREFIYSEDVASAVAHVLNNDVTETVLNVGVGRDWSIREMAEMIADVINYQGEIIWDTTQPDGAPQKLLDSQKIVNMGWKPKTDIRQGIQTTYNWYCNTLS